LKHYIFSEGIPSATSFDFEESLFNLEPHRAMQATDGWVSFCVINEKKLSIAAVIHFHVREGWARSPLKAPFGSIDCSADLPAKVFHDFVSFIEKALHTKGVKNILIKCAPTLAQGKNAVLLHVNLLNLGYRISCAEIGAVIPVDGLGFESRIDGYEKRRLKQAKESGLIFREIKSNQLETIYNFILRCRQEKGYTLSMDFNALNDTFNIFPDRHMLFGIFNHDEMIAASIAIRVKQDMLYNFYSAHSERYNNLSPVVMLIEGLYQHAALNKIAWLDLGTSALDGKPNFGLLDFKMNLGAEPTPKYTFEKTLG
jgi:hypothetical protein